MVSSWRTLTLIVAMVITAAAGCTPTKPVEPTAKPKGPIDLTILHTADVGGYIDPCG